MVEVVRAAVHVPSGDEARSYLHDGRLVVWRHGSTQHRCAVDAEVRRPPPPHVAARAQGDVWTWWTRLEALCKVLDVPVLAALRDGLPEHACAVRVVEHEGLVVAFAAR